MTTAAAACPPIDPTPASVAVRQRARCGELDGPTAHLAPGFAQANLAVMPQAYAAEFLLFCQRNPKPCPLLGVSEPGRTSIPGLGDDLDLRTDVRALWRDDLVAFAIGCSFSFDEPLVAEGIDVRHVSCGCNVPMYRTSIPTAPAGRFAGPLVVSMRPLKAADAIRAIQISSRFPAMHGAPVHLGDPSLIGIADLSRPDYGDAVEIRAHEIPVFWACGVTPQAAIAAARIPLCITHAPGHMLVTDVPTRRFAML